jgi:hypothetical protein
MIVVCALVKRHRTGYSNREPALPGLDESHDLAIPHEHIDGSSCGRRLPAVVEGQLPCRMLVNEHERTTTNAGALRFDEAQHCMGGDCSIHSMAALFQHLDGSSDGVRIRCGRYRPAVPRLARFRVCDRTDGSVGIR